MSEESKKKMSKSRKKFLNDGGSVWNKNKKGSQIAWNKGRKLSKEHREKLSISHQGQTPPNKGKIGKRKYGAEWSSPSAYQKRLEKLAGKEKPLRCELCGTKRKIVFDHDHKTGKFRGWICYQCNNALGSVNDDIRILSMMIEYIKNNNSIFI